MTTHHDPLTAKDERVVGDDNLDPQQPREELAAWHALSAWLEYAERQRLLRVRDFEKDEQV
jgi:hypothetical protein